MSKKIKIGVVGIGNCCSSLVQGLSYYKNTKDSDIFIPGLMHNLLGEYRISDIELTSAFDIDVRKVGKDVSRAIFEQPNCTKKFSDVPILNVVVQKGPILDGIADHMHDYFQTDENQKELSKEEIISLLKESKTDILINYAPVGSQKLTEFWAQIAIDTRCGFINSIPVFIASNDIWADKFKEKNLPIIGDDVKSQLGATIIHRALTNMIVNRGATIDSTHQINVGGNTDFRNMTDQSRLVSKRISKTESVASQIPYNTYVYAGPNGCIDSLNDNKICHLRMDFRIFGDIPCYIDLKLSVEDSPNSAGVVIDAIRLCKLALDRGIGGPIISASAYLMKHPPEQFTDNEARELIEDFINGV